MKSKRLPAGGLRTCGMAPRPEDPQNEEGIMDRDRTRPGRIPKTGLQLSSILCVAVSLLALMSVAVTARAQTETVIHAFTGPTSDGANPRAGLTQDGAGNFYGTTEVGGAYDRGTVFELVKSSSGYTMNVLHSFNDDTANDGGVPRADLVMDGSGNLYGTTETGGDYTAGTVFMISPPATAGGAWTETVLHSFNTDTEGDGPHAGLVRDASGNLYGTLYSGGDPTCYCGAVFELTPPATSGGAWTETNLYNFTGDGTNGDGYDPEAGLVMVSGNLYGTTEYGGGTNDDGTVFELSPSSGSWTETVVHSFQGYPSDGAEPAARLALAGGNLYGTTSSGGANDGGTVFELSGSAETVLYSFTSTGGDAKEPYAAVIMDGTGNLYGTTAYGGTNDDGAVFKLTPSSGGSGAWTETTLHSFTNVPDGYQPYASLLRDASGNLFGTTVYGGDSSCQFGCGIVFEVSPATSAPAVTLSPTSLDFGQVPVNTESAAQPVTVTNTGAANLIFAAGAVTLEGADPSDFTITADSCSGQTVTPNNPCSVSVAFSPNAAGSETGSLVFTDNASDSPQSVALSGTGLTAQQAIQNIIQVVNTLYSDGMINGGQDNSLVKQLQHAIELACGGNINGAIGNLESFISEVEDLEGSGTLTLSQATALIDAANSVIASLQAATGPITCS